MEEENKFEYVERSQAGNFYRKHVDIMAPVSSQPVDRSFAVPKEGLSFSLLKELADSLSVGKRRIVVIEHEAAYEIQRIPDNYNLRLFYRYLNENSMKPFGANSDTMENIKRIAFDYLKSDVDKNLNYDKNLSLLMQQNNVISYAYLQRRIASLAAFRRAPEGSSMHLKNILGELEKTGFIVKLTKATTDRSYGTSAKLYQIMETES